MRITEKDKKINAHIEENGFATVKQIGELFFAESTFKSQQAQKRLKALIEYGYIKQYKAVNCSQNIYAASDKFKRQTLHNIIAMDVIVKFMAMKSVKVLDYKREKTWSNGKVISDGFISVSYPGKEPGEIIMQSFIIEVHQSNNKWKNTLEKYNNESVHKDIIKNTYEGSSPTILFIDSVSHKMDNIICPYQIIQIDSNLTDFPFIFTSY